MSTIAQLVYDRQHKWLGHVLCMDNERIAKILLQGKVDGTRRRGKPRTAWMSAVEERTGISLPQAADVAQDREKWRKIAQNVGAYVRPTRLNKK